MSRDIKIPDDFLLFNSNLEVALRILVLLSQDSNNTYDLDRLVIFDYFIVHANDVDSEQMNLHPSLPLRGSEIIIKRKLISEGLDLLVSRGLIEIVYQDSGVYYQSNSLTKVFVELLKSDYFKILKKLSTWVAEKYSSIDTSELNSIVNKNIQRWGGEFEFESLVRGNYE
ncbi:ABC-three component system middle component 2 [Candidatus Pristimantibacillus sp. PTI5]|uniref:ABC-three component system middle component 2 n=1 Tax=Candidatus Pristimantibacillus sp. PTI5 TaxID=3400422 RepID=UPI003B024287